MESPSTSEVEVKVNAGQLLAILVCNFNIASVVSLDKEMREKNVGEDGQGGNIVYLQTLHINFLL